MSPRAGRRDAVDQLVDDQPVLVLERRRHAHALDARHLEAERHDQDRVDGRRGDRLDPGPDLLLDARERDGARGLPVGRDRRRRAAAAAWRGAPSPAAPTAGHGSWRTASPTGATARAGIAVDTRPRAAPGVGPGRLQLQVIPQPLGLRPADRDLRGLRVLHPEDVIPAEPGDYLLDLVDVDEMRPMHPPEHLGVEARLQFVERPVVATSRRPVPSL